MADRSESTVVDSAGTEARIEPIQEDSKWRATLPDGRIVLLDRSAVRRREDGRYEIGQRFDELSDSERVIPLLREELEIDRRTMERTIRIHKTVEERVETVEEPVVSESVEIDRVPVERFVDEAPPIREEGDVTIIPILEEVLVVEKRLMVREEVRIRRRTERHTDRRDVPLRREDVRVERGETAEQRSEGPRSK
jgi:uncharacterized protein (TIGR02271 family)